MSNEVVIDLSEETIALLTEKAQIVGVSLNRCILSILEQSVSPQAHASTTRHKENL